MTERSPDGLPSRPLRVAAVQMESAPGDKEANFARLEGFVAQAAQQSVRLIVFPECCLTGYWFLRNLGPKQLDALFMAFANGVGVDDDEIRTGNAMILDPYGRILSESGP